MEANGTTQPGTSASDAAGSPQGMPGTTSQGSQSIVERAQSQASAKIKDARNEAVQTLTSIASTLHQSGSQLRSDQQNMAGDYLEKAADGIERVAQYLQNTDAGEVADNLERFARRRPELFIGGAFAVGLIAARFLKSSGSRASMALQPASLSQPMSDREVPTAVSNELDSTTDGSGLETLS